MERIKPILIDRELYVEQYNVLKKHIDNIDEVLVQEDVNDILDMIDDAIVATFDRDGILSEEGRKLEVVFSHIFRNWKR